MVFRVQLVLVFFDAIPRSVKDLGFPETAVQNLRSLPPASIELLSSSQATALSLRVLSATAASAESYKWRRPAIEWRGEHVVVLEGAVEHDLDALAADVAQQHENMSRDELTSLAETLVASDVLKLAGDLSLAASIAVPGALEPTEIQCMVDGHSLWGREMSPTNIAPARAEATQKGWPPIQDLPLIPVLQWLRDIPGFRDGVPAGSLGRAVAALSRLLGYEDNVAGAALMWFMVGLEALYTSGKEGLSEPVARESTSPSWPRRDIQEEVHRPVQFPVGIHTWRAGSATGLHAVRCSRCVLEKRRGSVRRGVACDIPARCQSSKHGLP